MAVDSGDRVRLQNQIECLLEQMLNKVSIVVSNLLGMMVGTYANTWLA